MPTNTPTDVLTKVSALPRNMRWQIMSSKSFATGMDIHEIAPNNYFALDAGAIREAQEHFRVDWDRCGYSREIAEAIVAILNNPETVAAALRMYQQGDAGTP